MAACCESSFLYGVLWLLAVGPSFFMEPCVCLLRGLHSLSGLMVACCWASILYGALWLLAVEVHSLWSLVVAC